MKTRNVCHTCLDYYGCKKMGLKPSIGECSIRRPDRRTEALLIIAETVKREGVAFLRHPVSVTQDFIGMDFNFTVRSVTTTPGTRPESLDFTVGTDEYGEKVHAGNLGTSDLIKIANEI